MSSLLLCARHAEAVTDLTRALEMSPENEKEVVGTKLKEAQQAADKQASSSSLPQSRAQSNTDASTSSLKQAATADSSLPPSQTHQSTHPSASGHSAASAQPLRQQPTVEDGHVSEAESDVEEIPAQADASLPEPQRPTPVAGPPPGMSPGMDSEQMRNMMQNPGMMRQAADMMRSMDPAQLQSMARMAGAPGTPLQRCPHRDFCTQ